MTFYDWVAYGWIVAAGIWLSAAILWLVGKRPVGFALSLLVGVACVFVSFTYAGDPQ